jgi:hypothetical protein
MAFSRRDSYPGGLPADFGPRANAFHPLAEKYFDDAAMAAEQAQAEAHELYLSCQQKIEDVKARYFFYGIATAFGIMALVVGAVLWLRVHP